MTAQRSAVVHALSHLHMLPLLPREGADVSPLQRVAHRTLCSGLDPFVVEWQGFQPIFALRGACDCDDEVIKQDLGGVIRRMGCDGQ